MPDILLDEVLAYGLQKKLPPLEIANAVKSWHRETVGEGRQLLQNDPETFWKGAQSVDEDVRSAIGGLAGYAMEHKAREFFPDPEQRRQFLSVLESSSFDPEKMDAPPEWQERARAVSDAAAALDANPTPTQAGTIGSGPTTLASYDIRAREDGMGYEAMILPNGKGKKPVLVNLTGDREGLKTSTAQALADANLRYQRALNSAGSDIGFMTDKYEKPKQLIASNTARLDLYTNGPLSRVLHEELDQNLRNEVDPENRATG